MNIIDRIIWWWRIWWWGVDPRGPDGPEEVLPVSSGDKEPRTQSFKKQSSIINEESGQSPWIEDTARLDWLEKKNLYLWANTFMGETWRAKIDKARGVKASANATQGSGTSAEQTPMASHHPNKSSSSPWIATAEGKEH